MYTKTLSFLPTLKNVVESVTIQRPNFVKTLGIGCNRHQRDTLFRDLIPVRMLQQNLNRPGTASSFPESLVEP